MTDLHDVIAAARPEPTPVEEWRMKQRRVFLITVTVSGLLFFVGVGWLIRPGTDASVAIWALAIGLMGLLVSFWFGLRSVVGEPPAS